MVSGHIVFFIDKLENFISDDSIKFNSTDSLTSYFKIDELWYVEDFLRTVVDQYRIDKNLSVSDLAQNCGIFLPSFSLFILGGTRLDIGNTKKLGNYLMVDAKNQWNSLKVDKNQWNSMKIDKNKNYLREERKLIEKYDSQGKLVKICIRKNDGSYYDIIGDEIDEYLLLLEKMGKLKEHYDWEDIKISSALLVISNHNL